MGKQFIVTPGAESTLDARMDVCTREELIEQMLCVWIAMARTEIRPIMAAAADRYTVVRQRLQLAEAAYRAALPPAITSYRGTQ
jgi:hypothetical protein